MGIADSWTPEDERIMREQQAAAQSKGQRQQTSQSRSQRGVATRQGFQEDGRLRRDKEPPVGKSTLGHEWIDFRHSASKQSLNNALSRKDLSPGERSIIEDELVSRHFPPGYGPFGDMGSAGYAPRENAAYIERRLEEIQHGRRAETPATLLRWQRELGYLRKNPSGAPFLSEAGQEGYERDLFRALDEGDAAAYRRVKSTLNKYSGLVDHPSDMDEFNRVQQTRLRDVNGNPQPLPETYASAQAVNRARSNIHSTLGLAEQAGKFADLRRIRENFGERAYQQGKKYALSQLAKEKRTLPKIVG